MGTAFADMDKAIFGDPSFGLDAVYTPWDRDTASFGTPVNLRAILLPVEELVASGQVGAITGAFRIDLLAADVPLEPAEGSRIVISPRMFRIRQAQRDELGLTWECGCDLG